MENKFAHRADHDVVRRRFFDLTADSLRELLAEWNEPAYRATQIVEWVYRRGAASFDEMTNLSKTLRDRLAAELVIYESTAIKQCESTDGTLKLLLGWADGSTCECVLIPGETRRTACLSTQVGCPVRCTFCASGLEGLERQLSAGQIVEQAMRIRKCCEEGYRCPEAARLSNVVFMGSGEPLANYDATVAAVRTINAQWGMGIGARKITLSTIGLPKQMRSLAEEGLQITLALSLHAPTDELRHRLIPWAQNVTIESLIEAAGYYFTRTGREVTLEYILLGGVNDTGEHARQLATVARKMRSNVNLIAYNAVEGLSFERPTEEAVSRFAEALRCLGVNTHVRRSRGQDVNAACGQLRRRAREALARDDTDRDANG